MKRRDLLKFLPLSGFASIPFVVLKNKVEETIVVDDCETTSDIEGPFYIENAPFNSQISSEGAAGTTVLITGTVYAKDCTTPIADAVVDVWHANDAGDYEDNDYRGQVKTDESGNYAFQTILPGKYLNGSQFRPRHFHYKVRFENLELTTQIYFEGDTSIPIDPWASDPDAEGRIITLTEDNDQNLHGVVDVYLDVIIDDVKDLDKGKSNSYLKSIHPNPVQPNSLVQFYLNKTSTVKLELLDLQGRNIQTIQGEKQMSGGFHQIAMDTNNHYGIKMPSGIYVLQLMVDGRAIDAKRVAFV